jgi:hypothetical protein
MTKSRRMLLLACFVKIAFYCKTYFVDKALVKQNRFQLRSYAKAEH